MELFSISRRDLQNIIDKEWRIAEDFLSELAEEQGMSLLGIKRKHHIRRPRIEDVIENCFVLCEDEFMWARVEGTGRGTSAAIAARILQKLFKRAQNTRVET